MKTVNKTEDEAALEKEMLLMIKDIVVKAVDPKRIYLLGSRAAGKNKSYSDFDIAIKGANSSFRTMRKVRQKLDKALGIHSVDLLEMDQVSNEFGKLIEEKGKVIYERD
jgi:predicted nucleotidyltransferase